VASGFVPFPPSRQEAQGLAQGIEPLECEEFVVNPRPMGLDPQYLPGLPGERSIHLDSGMPKEPVIGVVVL
jgi:hypothetical protein